jgi:hypothetical protein
LIWLIIEWEYVEHNQLWNHTIDVSGNTNANKLIYKISAIQINNTTILNSETNSYNSKIKLGSGYMESNPVNSFTDISTCHICKTKQCLYWYSNIQNY